MSGRINSDVDERLTAADCPPVGPSSTGGPHVTGTTPGASDRRAPIHSSEALHQIARLVEQYDLPFPNVIGRVDEQVVVFLDPDDLPAWVIALDIPAPDWLTVDGFDGGLFQSATWPRMATFQLLFRISCSRRLPHLDAVVESAEPTARHSCCRSDGGAHDLDCWTTVGGEGR